MTVIANAGLVLKDSQGNEGIVKSLTDNDIDKISNAITDVGQVVDPATHMPIEATKTSAGVVQLATAQDITNGTAGKVVDAQELNNFAQTLPAANGVTDVSSGDNSNQLVVSRIGGSKTLTIDNVEHAGTATSADSVAWDKVSGKPSTFTPSSHDHSRYGVYFTDVCADTNTGWYESSYKGVGDDNQTHLYINDYFGIHFHTTGSFDVNGHAIISEGNIGSQSVNYANSAGSAGNADTVDGSHAWQMQTLAADGGIHGSGAWLLQCQHNVDGDSYFKLYCGDKSIGTKVDRASSAGYADSAGGVAWGNVSGRPTAVSQFTNDSGYITTDGAAYPRRVGGVTMNFNWSGQGGQPTWLWGGEDGTNMYVYNPANFSVNYANSAGSSSIAIRDSGGSWISGRDNAVAKQIKHNEGSWNPVASVKTINGNWTIGTVGGNALQFSYDTDADYNAGNNTATVVTLNPEAGTIITSANIGSQSVNYANSAGSAENSNYTYWLRTSSHHDHLFHTEWDGGYFWTYVAAPDGGYRAVRVERSNSSGWADSAGSVAWGNVSGRPDIWIG